MKPSTRSSPEVRERAVRLVLDRDEIRRWYNGHGWRGGEKVYNPFDILLLFRLEEKDYVDKYRYLGQPIHLVGVEFSREERNVAAFAVERA